MGIGYFEEDGHIDAVVGIAGDGEALGGDYAGGEVAGHTPGAEAVGCGADGDVCGVAYCDGFFGGYSEFDPCCFAGDDFAEVVWKEAAVADFSGAFEGDQHHVYERENDDEGGDGENYEGCGGLAEGEAVEVACLIIGELLLGHVFAGRAYFAAGGGLLG